MIFSTLKKNPKYLIVAILLITLFLFGRYFDGSAPSVDQSSLIKQIETENIQKGLFTVKPQNKPRIINLPISFKKGDSARLFYNVGTSNELLDQPFEMRPMDFSLYLISDYGEEQLIDKKALSIPTKTTFREIKFISQFDASKLVIKRNDTRTTGNILISDIRPFRLNVGSDRLSELKPTIFGRSDVSEAVFKTADTFSGRFNFVFTQKEQSIGQVFLANFEQISSVDLALLERGNGGDGNYLIELREVMANGKYSDPISQYYFSRKSIDSNLIGNNVYRFPLAANLAKGKKYIISVDDSGVQFNLLNTLKIGSSDSDDITSTSAITEVAGGKPESTEQIFIKINGTHCFEYKGKCMPNGLIIQDFGSGTGQYNYESRGTSIDLLDLDKPDEHTTYDNSVGGIIAPTIKETSFYYKFDTIYPFKAMNITLDQNVVNAAKNLLFYSFDQKNWIPIVQNDDGNLSVEQIVKPSSDNQRELFLKITYDPIDAKYKQSSYFGLKGIKVQASLVIN